jgi:hypothetical protein
MAGTFASKHKGDFDGLVLMASYTTEDISDSGLKVVSIYGSKDGVLQMDKYQEAKKNLPKDCKEVVLEGGIHSYFGNYGIQDKDGEPTMSREEQQQRTVEEIEELMK